MFQNYTNYYYDKDIMINYATSLEIFLTPDKNINIFFTSYISKKTCYFSPLSPHKIIVLT